MEDSKQSARERRHWLMRFLLAAALVALALTVATLMANMNDVRGQ